ncbi:CopG family ribbon-helix-helix protein [Methylococcus sp. EFPC2]|uniref:CopG family ribbon-helix-helix protein n=1 Tax=Methylococcus sp. EFPC2 TaxID=2812648 RepID=UPI001967A9AB|nr:CopG family ribbon-helix-helix protein [Methylococcus sp. EFPC2]QSA95718.1 CopG family ribbon-helix-helix protein [Methylococcus sp. EFPC2]
MSSLTLRISEDIKRQLEVLAQATGRTKSFLAVEAIRAYLKTEEWQVAEIRRAIAEADQGDFAEEEEVQGVRDKWQRDAG